MHIKMHIRTDKLDKKISWVISTCPDSTEEGARKGKGQGREKERRAKVEGTTEGEEGRHGEFGWGGDCATAPRGIDATG